MNYGLIAIGVSIVCLLGSLTIGLPVWVNAAGFMAGIVGLVLLGKKRTGGDG